MRITKAASTVVVAVESLGHMICFKKLNNAMIKLNF